MSKVIKVILIILAVIIILFAGAMLFFKSYAKINTVELESNEKVLQGNSDKKALVLYQESKHDTAKNITMALAHELNSEGYTVVINHPSSKLNYSIRDFDVFAFGSAVYMGQVSKPLQKYLDNNSFDGKDVMIYAIGEAKDEPAEVNLLKSKVKNANLVEGIKVKKGEEDRIIKFVKDFIK